MSSAVVAAREISRSFPDGSGVRQVLCEVNLDVNAGSMVAIVGRSGCGKTTLLKILAGLLRPDAGTVTVCGSKLRYDKPATVAEVRLRSIGYVAAEFNLIEDESVRANVDLPLRLDGSTSSRMIGGETAKALARVQLQTNLKARVDTLSTGERQRVALARALVRRPALLVADEPTAALDSETGQQIVELLRSLTSERVAVLIATHDPAVMEMCDTVCRLAGAKLGTPEQVSRSTR